MHEEYISLLEIDIYFAIEECKLMMTSMPTTSNVLLCILSTYNYDVAFCFL